MNTGLQDDLATLRSEILRVETTVRAGMASFTDGWSATGGPDDTSRLENLAAYMALRRMDLTTLQGALSRIGLSSLGRSEAHILSSLAALHATIDRLTGVSPASPWPLAQSYEEGPDRIGQAQTVLFGGHPGPGRTRVMVTLPTEAAEKPSLATALVAAGASCFRINCAHDGPEVWENMLAHVREAAANAGRHCPVVMDIGGPKIRTILASEGKGPRINRGDRFVMTERLTGEKSDMPIVAISHEGLLRRLQLGMAVWIDDGKIGARVVGTGSESVTLEAVTVREKGVRLKAEKGVNFPAVPIEIDPVTDKDLVDLDFIARHGDMVGFSFVQRPQDVTRLSKELAARRPDLPPMPVMLKIETALAVKNLPSLIAQCVATNPTSVMIARGDLAMEVGPERLSEVQEEILWLCEAAHIPVIWATQVLETMVKEGLPTRAEVTDAAMGQRAECVMLNKGPYIAEATRFLSGILRRMDRHQVKKSARLTPLTSWPRP